MSDIQQWANRNVLRFHNMGEIYRLLEGEPSLMEQNVSHTVVFYYTRTKREKKQKSQADTSCCEQKLLTRNQVYRDRLTN